MKKSVENLKTSKITGGLRHPLKTRQKFDKFILISISFLELYLLKEKF